MLDRCSEYLRRGPKVFGLILFTSVGFSFMRVWVKWG